MLFFNAVRPFVLPHAPPSGLFRSNKPDSGFSGHVFLLIIGFLSIRVGVNVGYKTYEEEKGKDWE